MMGSKVLLSSEKLEWKPAAAEAEQNYLFKDLYSIHMSIS